MSKAQTPQTLRGKVALWASIVVMFVVAIMLFLILVKPAETTEQPSPRAAETTGECNVPAGDTSSKPAMPEDFRWEADKGWTWPVSDTYGPTKTKDGFPACSPARPSERH